MTFFMEGPCLQTVPASSPWSRATEEFVTFCHGKPEEGMFLSPGSRLHEEAAAPVCLGIPPESHIPFEIFTMAEIMGY